MGILGDYEKGKLPCTWNWAVNNLFYQGTTYLKNYFQSSTWDPDTLVDSSLWFSSEWVVLHSPEHSDYLGSFKMCLCWDSNLA